MSPGQPLRVARRRPRQGPVASWRGEPGGQGPFLPQEERSPQGTPKPVLQAPPDADGRSREGRALGPRLARVCAAALELKVLRIAGALSPSPLHLAPGRC